ncbi:hypothetical protein M8818_005933 [Zalaria obscura]|uniref:Uncharacterized protein n=1 Tax=Zalaria obscura TaxID=2024903 RepID=A0ACC3S7I7_9PEZI
MSNVPVLTQADQSSLSKVLYCSIVHPEPLSNTWRLESAETVFCKTLRSPQRDLTIEQATVQTGRKSTLYRSHLLAGNVQKQDRKYPGVGTHHRSTMRPPGCSKSSIGQGGRWCRSPAPCAECIQTLWIDSPSFSLASNRVETKELSTSIAAWPHTLPLL